MQDNGFLQQTFWNYFHKNHKIEIFWFPLVSNTKTKDLIQEIFRFLEIVRLSCSIEFFIEFVPDYRFIDETVLGKKKFFMYSK